MGFVREPIKKKKKKWGKFHIGSDPPYDRKCGKFSKKKKKLKKFKKPYKAQNKAISITFKNFGKFWKIFEKIQRGDPWRKKILVEKDMV